MNNESRCTVTGYPERKIRRWIRRRRHFVMPRGWMLREGCNMDMTGSWWLNWESRMLQPSSTSWEWHLPSMSWSRGSPHGFKRLPQTGETPWSCIYKLQSPWVTGHLATSVRKCHTTSGLRRKPSVNSYLSLWSDCWRVCRWGDQVPHQWRCNRKGFWMWKESLY